MANFHATFSLLLCQGDISRTLIIYWMVPPLCLQWGGYRRPPLRCLKTKLKSNGNFLTIAIRLLGQNKRRGPWWLQWRFSFSAMHGTIALVCNERQWTDFAPGAVRVQGQRTESKIPCPRFRSLTLTRQLIAIHKTRASAHCYQEESSFH